MNGDEGLASLIHDELAEIHPRLSDDFEKGERSAYRQVLKWIDRLDADPFHDYRADE